jgi:carbamoyl-phosphate synthase large subunit
MVNPAGHHPQEPLRLLVTGAGAPGIAGTLYAIRNNPDERPTHIVAVDIEDRAVGGHLAEAFHVVPPPEDASYLDALTSIGEREGIEVVIPQTTREIAVLSQRRDELRDRGLRVAVASASAVKKANDKHALLECFRQLDLPHPAFRLATTEEDLISQAAALGYPRTPVVVKPPVSNGMRGMRILREDAWDAERFLRDKPSGVEVSLDELLAVLRRGREWPALLVTEYLSGPEYSVDCFRGAAGEVAVPRLRRAIRSGISFDTVVEWRDDIIEFTLAAAEALDLQYAFGFQFKLDDDGVPKVLECNPRVQGTMAASIFAGVNCIWLAVQEALGSRPQIPEPVGGEVRFKRYWGGIAIVDGRSEGAL